MNKEDIFTFIKKHSHCTLATVDESGNPEAAIIEFVLEENGEIIFDTSTMFRKYKNLSAHPKVAFTIGSGEENKGVQYEGVAKLLSGGELTSAKETYFAARPEARKWENEPDTVYFRVSPTWLRMRDYTAEPMSEVEFTL